MIWTPCCTRPGAERESQRDIEDLGFGTLLLSYRKLVYRKGQSRLSHRPLFPGYVFVALPESGAGCGEVAMVDGISCVLSHDGMPRRIRGCEAERLNNIALSCLLGDFNKTERRAANGRFIQNSKYSKRRRRPRRGKRLGKTTNIQVHANQRIAATSMPAVA